MLTVRRRVAGYARRLRPRALRSAWWSWRALLQVRRQLAAGVARPAVPRPPALSTSASIGVDAVLRRMRASCLESALVRQRWMASHGVMRDVVIGLPSEDFGGTPAHAWLDGTDPDATDELVELHRYPATTD